MEEYPPCLKNPSICVPKRMSGLQPVVPNAALVGWFATHIETEGFSKEGNEERQGRRKRVTVTDDSEAILS